MNKIKLHQALLQKIAPDKHLLKNVSTLLALKSVFPSSVILNFSSRREELAASCFISKRTLDNRILQLEKAGYITIVKNVCTLISYDSLYTSLKLDVSRIKYYRKRITQNPEYIIRSIVGKDRLHRQDQLINRKIEKIKGSLLDKDKLKLEEYERFMYALSNRLNYECFFNPDITLSQKEIAEMYGLSGQNRGFYWTRRLIKLGLMKSEQRIIQVQRKSRRKKLSPVKGGVCWHPKDMEKDLIQLRNKVNF